MSKYGWIPDIGDHNDHMYKYAYKHDKAPDVVDLRSKCPPVYDQGNIGSCTAQAIAAAIDMVDVNQWTPSRLFIYYFERVLEGTVTSDSGASIRDGMKVVSKRGVCREEDWPYDERDWQEYPSAEAIENAKQHFAIKYSRLYQYPSAMIDCLASGYPFIFGFSVYESFEDQLVAKTGIVQLPSIGEKLLGGHAVLAVGYNDKIERFLIRNSWGTNWGMDGYFTMPYEYLWNTTLSSDFWTIRQAT